MTGFIGQKSKEKVDTNNRGVGLAQPAVISVGD
jgi:hypothetical protein